MNKAKRSFEEAQFSTEEHLLWYLNIFKELHTQVCYTLIAENISILRLNQWSELCFRDRRHLWEPIADLSGRALRVISKISFLNDMELLQETASTIQPLLKCVSRWEQRFVSLLFLPSTGKRLNIKADVFACIPSIWIFHPMKLKMKNPT